MAIDTAKTIGEALDSSAKSACTPKNTRVKKASRKKAIKCHRPRKESTKTITTRLYSKWSEVVRAIAGNKCIVCGSTELLNAHHIIPRQICSGLRFSVENGACLCPSHHKFGKHSAHKNGLWFSEWLRSNDRDKHAYCFAHMDDELDCKDRLELYRIETDLHFSYQGVIGEIDRYHVTAVTRTGEVVGLPTVVIGDKAIECSAILASNPKMAEYKFADLWKKTNPDKPLKGIVKVEKVRHE